MLTARVTNWNARVTLHGGLPSSLKDVSNAKNFVVENLNGEIRETVFDLLDDLFDGISIDYFEDLDKKRIITEEYFPKYFSSKVPSDIIPDRFVALLKDAVEKDLIDTVVETINLWITKYPV